MNRFWIVPLLCVSACIAQTTAQMEHLRPLEMQWADYYARQYAVPPELVAAIIGVESGWHPYAVSDRGAVGLMQLMPATAYRFGVRNRFHVEENIRGGVAYLADLLRQFGGDLRLVAAGYYTGERRIRKLGLKCADPQIRRYVMAVERSYRQHRTAMCRCDHQ